MYQDQQAVRNVLETLASAMRQGCGILLVKCQFHWRNKMTEWSCPSHVQF